MTFSLIIPPACSILSKKNKKVKKTEPVILNEPDKLRLKDLWGNTTYFEKIFIISSFLLVGIIWIINTISGFIA